jgi:hypothetical protein
MSAPGPERRLPYLGDQVVVGVRADVARSPRWVAIDPKPTWPD